MEASERPQLPLDAEVESDGTVRALGDRIVIESLTVEDERAARIVRERAQAGTAAGETVRRAVEIGARVLDREETAAEVDMVRTELRSQLGNLGEALGDTVDGGAERITEAITSAFGAERNDSVQAQINEIVRTRLTELQQGIVRTLTSEDGSNPLVAVQSRLATKVLESEERHRAEVQRLREVHTHDATAMRGELAEMRKEVAKLREREDADARVSEAEEAGTRKGFTFEERVYDALERIASTRGDCATHTGAEGAEGGGKKGDVLVELAAGEGPAAGRIVFECKDKQLSKNAAWAELNEAMAARAASFGVLVVAGEDRIPAGREQLREYEGNKLVVAVDREDPEGLALAVAYRLAAARVAMARDRDLTVDAAEVRAATEEAVSCLKQAQSIRSALTAVKSSSDRARTGLDEMVAAVALKLERIDSLVAEADDAGQPDDE